MTRDWYQKQAAVDGYAVVGWLDELKRPDFGADPHKTHRWVLKNVGVLARRSAHFARLAQGCRWQQRALPPMGQATSCGELWTISGGGCITRMTHCPFCGLSIVDGGAQ